MISGGGYRVKVFKDGVYWDTFDNLYLANHAIKYSLDRETSEWTWEKCK